MSREEKNIIDSGILEHYALGTASSEERAKIEHWLEKSKSIQQELEAIHESIERHALKNTIKPPAHIKKRLFTQLKDEFSTSTLSPLSYPSLTDNHQLDYWESRVHHITPPKTYENLFVYDLGDQQYQTKVAWVKSHVPAEIHHYTKERFLLLAGSCTCKLGGKIIHITRGDYMEIPLHVSHNFLITSNTPAQFILQRQKVA